VLDAAGVEHATIIGASRGGAIAIDTALEYPDRVDGIVTIGSSASGFDPVDLTPMEQSMFADIDALWDAKDWAAMADAEVRVWSIGPTRNDSDLDPAFVAEAYALNRANIPRAEEDVDPIPLEPQAASRLDTIQIPALVTVGDSDVSECLAYADQLAAGLRYATKVVLPDSAHLPSVEHPEQFISVLLPWLDKNRL
jgi:pimeloyl-ACP methyl ester carboxylesterase